MEDDERPQTRAGAHTSSGLAGPTSGAGLGTGLTATAAAAAMRPISSRGYTAGSDLVFNHHALSHSHPTHPGQTYHPQTADSYESYDSFGIGYPGAAGGRMSEVEEEEYEEEESEEEDVFAYLPPNTAEQLQAQESFKAMQDQHPGVGAAATTTTQPPIYPFHPSPAYASASSPVPVPVPSSFPTTTLASTHPPISLLPVESPPQTNSTMSLEPSSENGDKNGGFRMRPLSGHGSAGVGFSREREDDEKGVGRTGEEEDLGTVVPMRLSFSLGPNANGQAVPTSPSPAYPHPHTSKRAMGASAAIPLSIPPASPPYVPSMTTDVNASQMYARRDAKRMSRGYRDDVSGDVERASGRHRAGERDIMTASTMPYTPSHAFTPSHPSFPSSSFRDAYPYSYNADADGYPYPDPDLLSSSGGANSIKMELDFDNLGIPSEQEEDSPYPEVRASVSNIDDPEMPALTLRMWVIGLLLGLMSGAANVFFQFRNPAPNIPPLVVLLLSYPVGKFLAYALPIKTYKFPSMSIDTLVGAKWGRGLILGGWEISLNPGPWNIKEHVLVYMMANVTNVPPYSLNMIVVSELYYGIKRGFAFNLVLTFATQLTGFGLAGLCRRFIVWPASMVWPQNLVVCTLLNTLHAEADYVSSGDHDHPRPTSLVSRSPKRRNLLLRTLGSGVSSLNRGVRRLLGLDSMSRYRFFLLAAGIAFIWFFVPGYLWTGLSLFGWVTWIAPNNIPVNQLFGVVSGLGMSVVTFDWTEISWIGSPLAVPWWAELHVFIGFVGVYWILTPILYYTNVWDLSYFPMSANVPYDNTGNEYDVQRVLTANHQFNATAYNEYSPLFLPATYAMTYLLAFALSTCVIVHTGLYHGRALINGAKRIRVEPDDIHAKLMRNYTEVPDWWYGAVFIGFFGLAIVMVEVWHTGVPVYMLCLSLMLPIIYVLPGGFIYAMTGQSINLNIIAQIIPGSLLPGNPLVNMLFKSYTIQTLAEALGFVQDLKLGHYIKVPPRATFTVQLVATTVAAVLQVGVKTWMFDNIPDICQPGQKSQLTCPHNQVFFTASAVWGLIGPSRQFGTSSIYHPQLFALLIGAFLPLPFWLYQRRYPKTQLKFINLPVLLNGIGLIPPATGINYSSWFAMGFVFQYLIRRKNFAWWSKYNYVMSAALDCGTFTSVLAVFFFLQFPRQGNITVNWWGNTVWQQTADALRVPFRTPPVGGIPR